MGRSDAIPLTAGRVTSGLEVYGTGRVTSGLEVYGTGRYITVTGRRWRKCPTTFAELDCWISQLFD